MKNFYNRPEAYIVNVSPEDIMASGLEIKNNPYGDDDRSALSDLFG